MKKEKAILCVDANMGILKSVSTELYKTFGKDFLVEVATNEQTAHEVVDKLATLDIHTLVIISDWLMPDMKTDAFFIEVHEKFPNIVKIMLSGQTNLQTPSRVNADAISPFVAKPWTKQDVATLISKHLV